MPLATRVTSSHTNGTRAMTTATTTATSAVEFTTLRRPLSGLKLDPGGLTESPSSVVSTVVMSGLPSSDDGSRRAS